MCTEKDRKQALPTRCVMVEAQDMPRCHEAYYCCHSKPAAGGEIGALKGQLSASMVVCELFAIRGSR